MGSSRLAPTFTTQGLERRFEPLKPVLARAHPHEAVPCSCNRIAKARSPHTPQHQNGCPARPEKCLPFRPATPLRVSFVRLPAAHGLRHFRRLTIVFAPTGTSRAAEKLCSASPKSSLGRLHHTRDLSSTIIFAHVQVSRSLPPACSVPAQGAKIVQDAC